MTIKINEFNKLTSLYYFGKDVQSKHPPVNARVLETDEPLPLKECGASQFSLGSRFCVNHFSPATAFCLCIHVRGLQAKVSGS